MANSPETTRRTPGRRALVLGGAAAVVAGAAAYRQFKGSRAAVLESRGRQADDLDALGWGSLGEPVHRLVATPDGAQLAVWDVGDSSAPTVVLPNCWGGSHAIWVPVARRLVESGCRVVLYDQRGHAASSRGTAPLTIEGLGHDLATVLDAVGVHDVVLAGHSMGAMTVMSLAVHRPEVLNARAKALVLTSTAAAQMSNGRNFAPAERLGAALVGSPVVSRAMTSRRGYRFVRGTFGVDPVTAQMALTARLFGECNGAVRGGYLLAMVTMNLVPGLGGIDMPTTVLVGSRDTLTPPARARQIVAAIPGARLVTVEGRGHMLPLEDPETVVDEILTALKG